MILIDLFPLVSLFFENGLDQVRSVFDTVLLSRYEDNLIITEVELIMAYIRSSIRSTELSQEEVARVQANLEKEMKEKGSIFIQKDSGLFEATK